MCCVGNSKILGKHGLINGNLNNAANVVVKYTSKNFLCMGYQVNRAVIQPDAQPGWIVFVFPYWNRRDVLTVKWHCSLRGHVVEEHTESKGWIVLFTA